MSVEALKPETIAFGIKHEKHDWYRGTGFLGEKHCFWVEPVRALRFSTYKLAAERLTLIIREMEHEILGSFQILPLYPHVTRLHYFFPGVCPAAGPMDRLKNIWPPGSYGDLHGRKYDETKPPERITRTLWVDYDPLLESRDR